MFSQAAAVTLRILLFRAGPQDFPYSAALTRLVVPLAMLVVFLQYRLSLPDGQAAVQAVAGIGILAGITWLLLRLRQLANRAQQTINALLATGSALTLLLLPPLSVLAPQLAKVAQDAQAAEALPAGPFLAVLGLSLWNFAVTSNIYRHALGANVLTGMAAALLTALVTVTLASSVTAAVSG